jgi:hypothetical protein
MFVKKGAIIMICIALILVAGCAWWDTKAYYAKHPTSGEDILQVWGKPYRIEMLEDGSFKWYHYYPHMRTNEYKLHDRHVGTNIYFIIKDKRVVDSGTSPN